MDRLLLTVEDCIATKNKNWQNVAVFGNGIYTDCIKGTKNIQAVDHEGRTFFWNNFATGSKTRSDKNDQIHDHTFGATQKQTMLRLNLSLCCELI
jgi:hypothetical protein